MSEQILTQQQRNWMLDGLPKGIAQDILFAVDSYRKPEPGQPAAVQFVVGQETIDQRDDYIGYLQLIAQKIGIEDEPHQSYFDRLLERIEALVQPAAGQSEPVADTRERYIAIREGERNQSEEEYFNARPQVDKGHNRHNFCAGFDRGFDAAQKHPIPAAPAVPEGWKLVPIEPSNGWAERYCALVNIEPDGSQTTFMRDGPVTVTFREKAKAEIATMLAASPDQQDASK